MSNTYSVDQERWNKLSIFHQMGNIYSEVGRSFKTRADANSETHKAAVARAIDLFDATIQAQNAAHSPKAREVSRAKEQFLAVFSDSNASEVTIKCLERYFMQFAIAARLNH